MQTGRNPALRGDIREKSARSVRQLPDALPLAEFRALHK
jgi:hypothetical protein